MATQETYSQPLAWRGSPRRRPARWVAIRLAGLSAVLGAFLLAVDSHGRKASAQLLPTAGQTDPSAVLPRDGEPMAVRQWGDDRAGLLRARLHQVQAAYVVLETDTGQFIALPKSRLTPADRAYVVRFQTPRSAAATESAGSAPRPTPLSATAEPRSRSFDSRPRPAIEELPRPVPRAVAVPDPPPAADDARDLPSAPGGTGGLLRPGGGSVMNSLRSLLGGTGNGRRVAEGLSLPAAERAGEAAEKPLESRPDEETLPLSAAATTGSPTDAQPAVTPQSQSSATELRGFGGYVAVSSSLLNQLLHVPINDQSQVGDVILGTYVSGDAQTFARGSVQLLPSRDFAALDFYLDGITESTTTGHRGIFEIHNQGRTEFTARKRIAFDALGMRLYATEAQAVAVAGEPSITTPLSGFAGRLVSRVAYEIVQANRDAANAEASTVAARRVSQKLDQTLNEGIQRWRRTIVAVGSKPAAGAAGAEDQELAAPPRDVRFRTTASALHILVGNEAPAAWSNDDAEPDPDAGRDNPEAGHDIFAVLPKQTIGKIQTAKSAIKLAASWFGVSLAPLERLEDVEPTRREWSQDGQWLTLAWDLDDELVVEFARRLAGVGEGGNRPGDKLAPSSTDPPRQQASPAADDVYVPFE